MPKLSPETSPALDAEHRHIATMGGARRTARRLQVPQDRRQRLHMRGRWAGGNLTLSTHSRGSPVATYSALFNKDTSILLPPGTAHLSLSAPQAPQDMRVLVTMEPVEVAPADPVETFFKSLRDSRGNNDSLLRRTVTHAK